ncbi:MAG: DNRLRE domain-containing protein [Chloroflexi bacterium]|nr:MAG: DNRLRE domain-containing protein [Chloroflexota bacterium]
MQLFPFGLKLLRLGALSQASNHPAAGSSGKRGRRLPPARSPLWPALIGGTLILFTFVVLSDQSGGAVTYTATFPAAEDTYVKNTNATTNYGQDTTLQADMEPSIKRALIRFSVTGIPSNATIQSATLRLFVVDESNQSGSVQRVNGSWSENTTTWNNAPAVGQQVAIIAGAAEEDTWKETNVLPAVTGNGPVNFYIITASTDGVDYGSRQNTQYQPTLVIRWSVPTSAPSPTPQSTPGGPGATATPGPTPVGGVTPGGPGATATPGPTPFGGAIGATYFVDNAAGNDGNSGTSESAAWRTVGKVSNVTLAAGDRVLFKRDGVWSGPLTLAKAGTADRPITIGSYGSGALPVIQGPGDCVDVKGTRLIVTQLNVKDCAWAGIRVSTGATFNRIDGNLLTGNVAGVHVASGASDNVIVGNTLQNNNRMSVNTPGGSDDNGAFAVLLNGDRNEVMNNSISGSDAFSYDYGRDGAAVEIYGGQGNNIHDNLAVDNDAFSELGNSRARDNTFSYNVVRSSLATSTFVVTRGSQNGFGPVANTRLLNNTVVMTGASSQGFVCHAGCDSSILMMRNNIIEAVQKVGYADAAFDEDYDLYAGGQAQFPLGAHSRIADPMLGNVGAGDFHLAAASPAVDTGVNVELTADFEGGHVPHDGNGDGIAVVDRGAFERGSTSVAAPPPTTPGPTATATPAPATPRATPTATAGSAPTPTPTTPPPATPRATSTATAGSAPSPTPTTPPPATPRATSTATAGSAPSPTPTPTPTPTRAPTPSPTPTPTPTRTPTPVASPTPSPTPRPTSTATPGSAPTPTPAPFGGDPVIAAAGDIACPSSSPGSTSCRQQDTANLINSLNPTAVLMLGDAQYDTSTAANLAAYYNPTWGQFLAKTWATAGGSHDFYGSGDWYSYFGRRAGPAPYANYSFDLGQWHIISMNSYCADAAHPTGGSCAAGSPGYNWLQNDLTTHGNQCTLVFWHQPRWSSGTTHGSDTGLADYFQLLYDHGVELLLTGHEHMYERFAPQNGSGGLDQAIGVRELVVGTGGRSVYGAGTPIANSEVLNNSTFGALKLTLHANSYDWQFVPIAGQTFTDSGSGACH